jgi:hypothetical protein
MENHRRLIPLLALLLATPASATDQPQFPRVLDGAAIVKLLEGKTLEGVYGDGTPVTESYAVGGKIPDYADPLRKVTGTWSVVNNTLCTFYDDNLMSGGCFRVEQVSVNCFDYYVVAGSETEALGAGTEPRYTARAHVKGLPDTCPDELSV